MQKKVFSHSKIYETIEQLCIKAGLPAEHSEIVADALTTANLRGIDTHGIRCINNYIKRFEHGSLNPVPNIRTVNETRIASVLDGDNALGHVVGSKGMDLAIQKAGENGIGLVCVRNSNHFGTSAYFSMKALKNNFIGISMTNATARLAPTGGVTPSYGNNPWSVAIPSDRLPIVVDMAISVVANSNLIIARERGTKIPLGWAATKEGVPTDDPNLAELLLPMGGYKGYAIALVVETLTGILSGASFGKEVGYYNSMDKGQDIGHFFAALDIEQFMPFDVFNQRINKFVADIKQSELAKGSDRVYLPGEKEFIEYKKRLENGIPVDEDTVEKVNQLCAKYGVALLQ